jgi:hypothetical protein
VGFAANYLLPPRLGELVRVDYRKRITGTGRAASTGTVVVERTLDGLTVLIFIVIGILVFGLDRMEARPAFAVIERLLLTAGLLFGGLFAVIMLSANIRQHLANSKRTFLQLVLGVLTGTNTFNRGTLFPVNALTFPYGEERLAVGGVWMPDAGLELELAIAQDLCLTRLPSFWGAWNGGAGSASNRSSRS